jgi:NHS family xanthosine MFS transporter
MFAWVLRFGLFGLGNPGSGLWLLILSMLVYGVAFDFFNVSGSLFVDKETPHNIRASAQGMFMLMTNGIGATIGTLGAQWVVNQFTSWQDVVVNGQTKSLMIGNWQSVWLIFALYALVVTILFGILFKYKHKPASTEN